MLARHISAAVDFRNGRSGDLPRGGRLQGDVVGDRENELLAPGELAEADRALARRVDDLAVNGRKRTAVGGPVLRGEIEQRLARGGGDLAQLQVHVRCRAAAK